jgi:hypothetical protein
MPSARYPAVRWLLPAVAVVVTALLSSASTASPAKFPPVDHFKCYIPDHPPSGRPGGVLYTQDQFDTKLTPAKVGLLFRFCNPVDKVFGDQETPIRQPNMHLTFYAIFQSPAGVAHDLLIANQLGKEKSMRIGPARWLAVPTSKNSGSMPSPKLLNHFKCYPVVKGTSLDAGVVLRDQWTSGKGVVLRPVIFCNPAVKVVKAATPRRYPIIDKLTHLTCYLLKAETFGTGFALLNQFNRTKLKVIRPDLLCVPSQKLKHNP